MRRKTAGRRVDINLEELDRIIDRSTCAVLTEAESQKLKTALHAMADRLTPKRSTEKTKAVLKDLVAVPATASEDLTRHDKPGSPAGHARNGAVEFRGANRVFIPHAVLQPGYCCPECGRGKVYRLKEPATSVRITGRPPLETAVFEMQRPRCNACGQVFTAAAPETAGSDKYAATALAIIALFKYGMGVPFKRLERLQNYWMMPLPAATQWELVAAGAKLLLPLLKALIWLAAQGGILHNDDTGMRILQLPREPGDKRTGIFTTGIVSMIGLYKIALFFTGPKHAGENIAQVLKQQARELPPPIQMCDALSRNSPKLGIKTLLANCLAHGRRQVVDVAENFPEECRHILETLGRVYRIDALARQQELSPEERLRFHQERSGPVMQELHKWMKAQLAEHKVEPNSGMGKAMSYLLNHWAKLTLFLSQAGAPIDNNVVERAQGAAVGDLFMSLIHTCELNSANPFHYLTELLRHAERLKQKPTEWMPWNYCETLSRLTTPSAA